MEMNLRLVTIIFLLMMWAGIVIGGLMAHCSVFEISASLAGSTAAILFTTTIALVRTRFQQVSQ